MKAIDKAIKKAGGLSALADKLGIRPQTVWNWQDRGKVPPDHAIAVEEATEGAVTRYELRPDIFGKDPERAGA
jgi:DNA-binding transcriptional regulator YdaS (Cro superfamily)